MAGKAGGPNLTRRLIDIGALGAPTNILATGPTRGWVIRESIITAEGAANVPQGFQIKIPNDGTVPGFQTWFQRDAPIQNSMAPVGYSDFPFFENWNHISEHGPYGEVFGGAGNAQPSSIGATLATLLALIQSATEAPTTIEIVEFF